MSWFKRGGNIPKGTRWLGLEVGHSAVKGAILSKKHGKVCLDQFLFEELPGPKDPSRDGQLTSALATLNLSQYGGIRTALVLEGRQVDVHLIRLPRSIPKKEREQAALLESLSRMSLNPEDAIQAALEQGEVGDEVVMLVAAASKTGLERYLEAVRRAGVEPDLITIGPVVLGAVPGRDSKKSTVVFNIGSQSTSMAVFHQDNLQHAREARVGSDPITDELAAMLGDDRSMGESIKRFWRLPKQGETSIPVDMNGEKFSIDPMSLGSLQQLCDELRRSVRFIRERERIPVDEVLLTGGGSLIAGLSEYLNFPEPVECKTANSLDGIEIDETKVHRPLLESIAPRMSQAIGAARLGLESPPTAHLNLRLNPTKTGAMNLREFAGANRGLVKGFVYGSLMVVGLSALARSGESYMQEKHDKLARYYLDQEVEETAPVFDWDRQSAPWVESLMVFSRQIPEGLRLNRLSTVPPESREIEQILDDELMVFFDDEETVRNNTPLIFRIEGETESREALTTYMKALREISTDGVHLEWTRRPNEEPFGTKAMSFGILIVIERNFVGEGI